MTRYLLYSTGLHALGLILAFATILRMPPKPKYFGVDFIGGSPGTGLGGPGSAPADRPTPPVKQDPILKPAEETLPEEPPSSRDKNRLLVRKKETPKKPPKATPTKSKTTTEKIKAAKNPKPGGDVYNKEKGVAGGTGNSLVITKSGAGGGMGLGLGTGGGGLGAKFPYTWYIQILYKKLWGNWDNSNAGDQECTVAFVIERSGSISGIKILESSGDDVFDRLAERAVEVSNPLPPLPQDYPDSNLPVYVKFKLE